MLLRRSVVVVVVVVVEVEDEQVAATHALHDDGQADGQRLPRRRPPQPVHDPAIVAST
jgi:hypothetical protein